MAVTMAAATSTANFDGVGGNDDGGDGGNDNINNSGGGGGDVNGDD
jgi:hypothetical protein